MCICAVSGFFFLKNMNTCIVPSTYGNWKLEIARTPEEHSRGLMYRKHLCDRCGMLFIFEEEKPQAFWMKNTYVPLDIYFYEAQWQLVEVARNMRPEYETKTPMIYRSGRAKYVLEVNAGSNWLDSDIARCLR